MKPTTTSIAIALCLLGTTPSQADIPSRLALKHDAAGSVPWLQAAYLHCDRVMSSQRADAAFAQRCAAVGEELKQRAFGGDFARLIAWWQGERRSAAAPAR